MVTQCPNGHGDLINNTCPKCGYSFAARSKDTPKKGNKYTEEVNRTIKGLLMEARIGDGVAPWQREWIVIPKRNYDSNRIYSGINRWLLSYDSDVCYITKESAEKHGCNIPDDACPRLVVAWVPPRLTKEEEKLSADEQKEILRKKHPFMITSHVFRSKDIPGLKEKTLIQSENKKFATIEEFLTSIKGLKLEEGGNDVFYNPVSDSVVVPKIEQFESSEKYYHAMFRALVRWTGHEDRLGRDEKKFQKHEEYGREELISEMGASYLCHYFNIPITENDVAYLDGWMRKIDADPNCLVSSGQQAEKVLKFFKLVD